MDISSIRLDLQVIGRNGCPATLQPFTEAVGNKEQRHA